MKIRIVLKSGYAIDTEVDDWGKTEKSFVFSNSHPHIHVEDGQVAAVIEFEDGVTEPRQAFGFGNQH